MIPSQNSKEAWEWVNRCVDGMLKISIPLGIQPEPDSTDNWVLQRMMVNNALLV